MNCSNVVDKRWNRTCLKIENGLHTGLPPQCLRKDDFGYNMTTIIEICGGEHGCIWSRSLMYVSM